MRGTRAVIAAKREYEIDFFRVWEETNVRPIRSVHGPWAETLEIGFGPKFVMRGTRWSLREYFDSPAVVIRTGPPHSRKRSNVRRRSSGRARVVHFAMVAGVSVGTFRAHVTARVRVVRPARRAEVVRALFQRTSAPPAVLGRALDRVSVITDGAFVALGAGRVVLAHLYGTKTRIFTRSPPRLSASSSRERVTDVPPPTLSWFSIATDVDETSDRFRRKRHDCR